jgi:arsenical pump membrane protein
VALEVHEAPSALRRARWLLLIVGVTATVVSFSLAAGRATSAARQDWPPFVLVSGLLLIGQVAWADGIFQAAGEKVARWSPQPTTLVCGSAILVAVCTAILNLDTSVAFLTPVLVHAARRRGVAVTPLLYLSVFLANGASLVLPGSNLTNLIVLAHHPVGGASFAVRMLLPWVVSVVITTGVVLVAFHREIASSPAPEDLVAPDPPEPAGVAEVARGAGAAEAAGVVRSAAHSEPAERRVLLGTGSAAVVVAVVAMLVLSPAGMAVTVLACGVLAVFVHVLQHRLAWSSSWRALNVPVLAGLFALAVGLGTLGSAWNGPSELLRHASSWESAAVGAALSVLTNNLPAASLLAARHVADPYALLIGLDLGPNLVVTAALSGVLWLQVGRYAGEHPSAARFTRVGTVLVPLSIAASLGALALTR